MAGHQWLLKGPELPPQDYPDRLRRCQRAQAHQIQPLGGLAAVPFQLLNFAPAGYACAQLLDQGPAPVVHA